MRKILFRAMPFAALSAVFIPGVKEPWRQFLSRALLPLLSRASGRASFPVAGIAALLTLGALLPRGRARRFAAILLTGVWLFLAIWMPLYGARPFAVRNENTANELAALTDALVKQANALYISGAEAQDVPMLALEAMRARFPEYVFASAPKYARVSEWMRALSIAGVYIPFTGEAIVNPEEPAFSLPFVACHELAHQAGIADEGQAGIAAYYACAASGDPAFQYAGCAMALKYALIALMKIAPESAKNAACALRPEVLADLSAIGAWSAKEADTRARPFFAGDYGDIAFALSAPEINSPSNPTA